MNNIIINSLKDLLKVIQSPIVITKNDLIKVETDCNMWTIGISVGLVDKLSVKDLEDFIAKLLANRSSQLIALKINKPVIFYLWFDAQALQLRFNLISSIDRSLPFGCKLTYLETYTPILKDFIVTTKKVAFQEDQVEYINPENDIDDDDDDNFTLNVYIANLGSHSFLIPNFCHDDQ